MTCINLFATPGLGSILGRRFGTGIAQVTLAVAGFLFLMWWFIQKMRLFYGMISGTDLPLDAGNTAGTWGLGLFIGAWIWSLITSIQMFKSVPERPMNIPPKIR
ncbi:MAG: hypothetical protein H0X66_22560 [Verrucomicrobia bacterium]|nr:hypothetical protein [Verrucomicrobiota bacterium]